MPAFPNLSSVGLFRARATMRWLRICCVAAVLGARLLLLPTQGSPEILDVSGPRAHSNPFPCTFPSESLLESLEFPGRGEEPGLRGH